MNELSAQHSVPVDITAVRVVKFRGERYTLPPRKITQAHSNTVLPTRPIGRGIPDLRGMRFGRFTVVGLGLRKRDSNQAAAWVCRCDCGNMEHRTARSIRNPKNVSDRCRICDQVQHQAWLATRKTPSALPTP